MEKELKNSQDELQLLSEMELKKIKGGGDYIWTSPIRPYPFPRPIPMPLPYPIYLD